MWSQCCWNVIKGCVWAKDEPDRSQSSPFNPDDDFVYPRVQTSPVLNEFLGEGLTAALDANMRTFYGAATG